MPMRYRFAVTNLLEFIVYSHIYVNFIIVCIGILFFLSECDMGKRKIYSDRDIVTFVDLWWKEKKYSPSIRDVQYGCAMKSSCTAATRLTKLVEGKLLSHVPHTARTIRLTRKGKTYIRR